MSDGRNMQQVTPQAAAVVCAWGRSSGLYVDGQAPDHIKDLQQVAELTVQLPQHTAQPTLLVHHCRSCCQPQPRSHQHVTGCGLWLTDLEPSAP